MNPIAKKIQDGRLKAKMTEKELAKKCGLSASYIIQIESGKKIINEKAAEAILAVFGEQVDLSYSSYIDDVVEKNKQVEVKKPLTCVTSSSNAGSSSPQVVVEPNDQWTGALAHIIKTFEIKDLYTQKVVGKKELPVLGKKIEGIPWEKLMFVRISDQEAEGLQIPKNGTVWIQQSEEIPHKGVYLIEWKGKKCLRRAQKRQQQVELSRGMSSEGDQLVLLSEIKVLGKCIRVEIEL